MMTTRKISIIRMAQIENEVLPGKLKLHFNKSLICHLTVMLSILISDFMLSEWGGGWKTRVSKGLHSSESTRLLQLWAGFDFQNWRDELEKGFI